MAVITVTPKTARRELRRLKAGDEVIFSPGRYGDVLKLKLNNDANSPPTILRGEAGAVITVGQSADDFREQGNQIAKDVQDGKIPSDNKYPGLYPHKMRGRLILKNCVNVIIEDLAFEESWPTHVAIKNCQDITFRHCHFKDATFAIAANGEATYGITIEHCTWVQDREPKRMWLTIPWGRIHGDPRDGDEYEKVDIKKDWRLFDGDFFRAENIAGGLTIRYCTIGQAFNAIHLYNTESNPDLSVDINVHDCCFYEIRDNVLEPETAAFNWWFWNNTIKNAHKPFSIDIEQGGAFYIFSNRWWFDSIQGPKDIDGNRTGGMFKFRKKPPKKDMARSYVFHNSIATRGDYARKGLFYGLQHFNNAIWCIREDLDLDTYLLKPPRFFGDLSVPDTDEGYKAVRFTTEWDRFDTRFEGDVIYDHAWPTILHNSGYTQIGNSIAADPLFQDFLTKDDLTLKMGSPCVGKGQAQCIEMPVGDSWPLPGGRDIGAYQGEELTPGPQFRPVMERHQLQLIKTRRQVESV